MFSLGAIFTFILILSILMVLKVIFKISKVVRQRSGKIEFSALEEVLIFASISYIITYIIHI